MSLNVKVLNMRLIPVQEALNRMPLPLVIVTVGKNGKNAGMTACWITQVSWKPPLVGLAIYNKWTTLKRILEYKEFAIHIISDDLVEPALTLFGSKSSAKVNKIREAKEKFGLQIGNAQKINTLVILDAPIVIECRLKEYYEVGDHYLVICNPITAYKNNDKTPTTYYNNKIYHLGKVIRAI